MPETFNYSGISESTPRNILFGAGTIHKGLKFTNGAWNYKATLVGATSGGSVLTVKPEIKKIEVDGLNVNVKGLQKKVGETATLETNVVEITPDILASLSMGTAVAQSDVADFSEITAKAEIVDGDYWENVAFVGKKADGTPIIAILDNALCTSGLSIGSKDKNNTSVKCTFECHQVIGGDMDVLPWRIYYQNTPVTPTQG